MYFVRVFYKDFIVGLENVSVLPNVCTFSERPVFLWVHH